MSERTVLKPKERFEIFKRDGFTCQYCGRTSPDVVLEIDHVVPVSKGGESNAENYVTSCRECNRGKGNTELDNTEKWKNALAELDEKREQLQAFLEWRKGQKEFVDQKEQEIVKYWNAAMGSGYYLNERGIEIIRKLLAKYSVVEVVEAMDIAKKQYIGNYSPTKANREQALNKIEGICYNRKYKSYVPDLYYIRGILKNRLHNINDGVAIELLEAAYKKSVSVDELKQIALETPTWSQWRESMERLIKGDPI